MIISDTTERAEEQCKSIKSIGKTPAAFVKKLATNVMKNPKRTLKNGAMIGSAIYLNFIKQFYPLFQIEKNFVPHRVVIIT